MSYVLAFLGFVALIILHEFGHFAVAKAVGMRVERFSLFMGPLLVKVRRGETEYGIGPFPLGGYVRITGMNPHEDIPPEVVPRAYYNPPVWKRIVVILAGPAMNLLIAFVIVWALVMSSSQAIPTTTVAQVGSGSPAAHVLRPGDEVISVDGVGGSEAAIRNQIDTHRCAGAQVNGCLAATPARVVVKREGQLISLDIRPQYSAADQRLLLGIAFGGKPANAAQAASITTSQLWSVTTRTVSTV
ncbi:MAG: site-2 protease family protein, partial [Solirubrobacterales bacterium]|nr:site-2 protease family protein [Solirubrobacterales bacterium]